MNLQSVITRLEKFEGCTPYMYICTGGEVTAGVGHAILNADEAVALTWERDGRPAAPEEVRADFASVSAKQPGLLDVRYADATRCRLSTDEIMRIAEADVGRFEAQLAAIFPDWDSYPQPAQEALFDMAFNLGIGGLKKFVRLLRAVEKRDWTTAATECRRNGIAEERNHETVALFRAATG
jgi:GH24 family phage-related lysozyme (muramidase)